MLKTTFTLICLFVLFSVYKDGVYSGKSQAQYTYEPYVGNTEITIVKGKIIKVDFHIIDTAKNVEMDSSYAKYFEGNELYKQQCRNDYKGIQTYPAKLIESQDIDKVDAITGATWSYHIFKASVKQALKKAGK